ncbi:hypothetical protein PU629_06275 [Pullulanibacillus sp. KACC 23026]|uniref:YqaI family protein n=1 Tax=Pullulanibacillus sp. KACC 23026 TaxID=3028315 RepID=UPI0023B0D1A6|nr:hypothetical protein [Pullulanibacillus sp. KACC 23026]WEG13970.1 hypothetical protein PU629_06275 [Pullulanibacillus sp. KACC 23026]
MKAVEDHPVEDMFGDEILSGDVYFELHSVVVLDKNIKRYLVEVQEVKCYKAQ